MGVAVFDNMSVKAIWKTEQQIPEISFANDLSTLLE